MNVVHALEGRLRIKIPQVKGSAGLAQEVEGQLRQAAGVEYASANPTTGNVLILYNPRHTGQRQIIASLIAAGYLSQSGRAVFGADNPPSTPVAVVEKVTATVAATLMEVALSRLVGALI
jgi:P-type Ca2+ transporter type 2C